MNCHFIIGIFILIRGSLASDPNATTTVNVSTPQNNTTEITMQINSSLLKPLFTRGLQKLIWIFQKYGHELRIVGGAVRDILMNKVPSDMDFGTTALPAEMKAMFEEEKIFMLPTNGEKHGTITPRICKQNFEITGLRKDLICDGRHAKVEFTKDWRTDALRRDLTINAMSLEFNGTLYDYFGGIKDLEKGRIIFVGDADCRIREDYLRILRYFRFFGRFTKDPHKHEPGILEAIKQNLDGLNRISGERIWVELSRLLVGPHCKEVVSLMLDLGLAPYLGLGNAENLDRISFSKLCELSNKYKFQAATYVASLLNDGKSVKQFMERCKISKDERDLATFIVEHKHKKFVINHDHPLRDFQELLIEARNKEQIKLFILELMKYKDIDSETIGKFEVWDVPKFPLDVDLLRKRGLMYGRQIGFVLKGLKRYWVAKKFNVSDDELMAQISPLVTEFKKFLPTSVAMPGTNSTRKTDD